MDAFAETRAWFAGEVETIRREIVERDHAEALTECPHGTHPRFVCPDVAGD